MKFLHQHLMCPETLVGAILSKSADASFLSAIKRGYKSDDFCSKFINFRKSISGICKSNSLWYIGDRLLIPHIENIREQLFQLAHNSLGHFGADKSY